LQRAESRDNRGSRGVVTLEDVEQGRRTVRVPQPTADLMQFIDPFAIEVHVLFVDESEPRM
jgi:hypothetical protein